MPKSAKQILKNLGWKIQKLRKETKTSQEKFADKLGISRVYMGYIEQGRERPSLKLLIKIARKFSVGIADLFDR